MRKLKSGKFYRAEKITSEYAFEIINGNQTRGLLFDAHQPIGIKSGEVLHEEGLISGDGFYFDKSCVFEISEQEYTKIIEDYKSRLSLEMKKSTILSPKTRIEVGKHYSVEDERGQFFVFKPVTSMFLKGVFKDTKGNLKPLSTALMYEEDGAFSAMNADFVIDPKKLQVVTEDVYNGVKQDLICRLEEMFEEIDEL